MYHSSIILHKYTRVNIGFLTSYGNGCFKGRFNVVMKNKTLQKSYNIDNKFKYK